MANGEGSPCGRRRLDGRRLLEHSCGKPARRRQGAAPQSALVAALDAHGESVSPHMRQALATALGAGRASP